MPESRPEDRRGPVVGTVLAAAALLVAARLAALAVSPLELYPDEAQYWGWSRDFAFGYYSKPPLVAWLIGATTAAFGDAEWAVRLSAPLLHAGGALFLFLAGRTLFDARAGAFAAIAWLTMPGVALSSFVIATDGPLLFVIAAAIYALAKLLKTGGWPWALALGVAVGLGFLAKYAMAFFVAGAAAIALFDRDARRVLLGPKGVAAAAAAALVFAPNLAWNAANEFATVSHTADNANLGAERFNPGKLAEFWVDQLAVGGPLLFPLMLAAGARAFAARRRAPAWFWLALLAAPALVVISGQAFLTRANANWAASAYPAAILLVCAWGAARARRWLAAGIAVNAAISALFIVICAVPALADALGQSNALKRMRGWDATTSEILQRAEAGGYATIAIDDRFVFQTMDYYARGRARPETRMWLRHDTANNHAELTAPLRPGAAGPILVVSRFEDHAAWLRRDFATLEPAGSVAVPLGGGIERRLTLYRAAGYDPVPRD